MLSGRATAWVRDVRRYVGALTADIKKTYPQLGDVTAEYAWNGTLGLTVHRMPQIGELGPGVWLASGFGGHGLNTTAMAGNLIARAIVEGDQTWRQFTPFELVWAGGVFGRAAAQMRVWIKRLRDRIEERRAKARELAHRQARDAEMARAARQVAPRAEPGDGAGDSAQETVRRDTQQDGVLQSPAEEPVSGPWRNQSPCPHLPATAEGVSRMTARLLAPTAGAERRRSAAPTETATLVVRRPRSAKDAGRAPSGADRRQSGPKL